MSNETRAMVCAACEREPRGTLPRYWQAERIRQKRWWRDWYRLQARAAAREKDTKTAVTYTAAGDKAAKEARWIKDGIIS